MPNRRQLTVAFALVALLWCSRGGAQVLDQVPDNAMVVLKIKNLQQLNLKVAKAAKDLGLDQMEPKLSDPLGALEEESKLTKGINKAGDLAIVMFDPEAAGGPDKAILVLVPISDYKAFVGNFKDPKADGDITTAKTPDDAEEIYMAKRGNFAAVAPNKELLARPVSGLKLKGAIAKEAAAKDAIVYANMGVIRAKVLPELQKHRKELLDEVDQSFNQALGDAGAKFKPVLTAVMNQLLNGAQRFMEDSTGVAVGLNISDAGLTNTLLVDFNPGSYLGKMVADEKSTDQPLVVGLPVDHKYLMYGGAIVNSGTAQQVLEDMLGPIVKELQQLPEAKSVVTVLAAAKKMAGATQSSSFGWIAPTAPLGQESIFQQVSVLRGDAKAIQDAQRQNLKAMSDLMKMLPQQPQASADFTLTPGGKTIEGVKLDGFQTKLKLDDNDPTAAQVQQVTAMLYGPSGMSGVMGAVNDKTFVAIAGGDDALAASAITAAKAGADVTAQAAGAQTVAALLPKNRTAVIYVDLGTIVGTAVRYAKGFGLPINANLAADLPPVGATVGSEGSTARVDGVIPMDLVKGLVRFGLEAQQQAGKPGGGL